MLKKEWKLEKKKKVKLRLIFKWKKNQFKNLILIFLLLILPWCPADKINQNILNIYDFSIALKTDKNVVTENIIKDYFNRHKDDKPFVKCASFFFLIFIGKIIDLESACLI